MAVEDDFIRAVEQFLVEEFNIEVDLVSMSDE